ncbi:MAG: leucine-rich repeat domain-containing protein, partial [Clostridia bacterium]|nr:leucine-rich repeat domain-containing protein [Clostridia bacterium]
VDSIGKSAFSGCISLEEAGLSDLIEVIPMFCFDGCISLSNVHIPSSLKEIGYNAFADCAITDVCLPDGVINIDRYAFIRNRALQSVYVPDSVLSLSNFTGCNSAVLYCEAAEQPSSWGSSWVCALPVVWNCKTYGMTDDGFKWCLTNLDEMVISGYAGDSKDLVVPNTVEDIEVTQIAFKAFYNCNGITSISLPFIGGVKDGDVNTNFGYIFGAKDNTYNSGYVPTTLREVIITGSSKIGELAFQSCSRLTKLVIPATVTEIGSRIVFYCNNITIYCEAQSKPDGWHDAWNLYNAPVVWGYTAD